MQFGGSGHFGGGFQYGGGSPRWQLYYRILKDLRYPGVYTDDDDDLVNVYLRTDAECLGEHPQVWVEALEREIFPHTAEETIDLWLSMYKIVPPEGSTLSEKQDLALARWRGALGSSNAAIRETLDTILNSTRALYDDFPGSGLHVYWDDDAGNGGIAVTSSEVRLSGTSPAQCTWDASGNNGPIVLYRTHDREDGFNVVANMSGATLFPPSFVGICIYQNDNNALLFGVASDAGNWWRVDKIESGTFFTEYAKAAHPGSGSWALKITRLADVYTFEYDTGSGYIQLAQFTSPVVPRFVGMFGVNWSAYPTFQGNFDDFTLTHDASKNNIAVLEQSLAAAQATDPDHKFRAFVHREPTDGGTYNITEAQRVLDRIKQAHTLITVGESKVFRASDPYSLTNRDVLGG